MTMISRVVKSNGTTEWATGDVGLASEFNGDFDAIVNLVNGGLDTANLKAGAAILQTQLALPILPANVDDSSAAASNYLATADTGSGASPILPTTLTGELQKLRYAIERGALGVATVRVDATGDTVTAWIDAPVSGPNLARNGAFQVKTTANTAAPDDFALVDTPATVDIAAAVVTEGAGKVLKIITNDADQGISQTFAGLRAGTLYFISVRAWASAGTARLLTSGADATSDFRDLTLTNATATPTTLRGVVMTDGTPASLVVTLGAPLTAATVYFSDLQVRECAVEPVSSKGNAIVFDTSTTVSAGIFTSAGFTAWPDLSAAVTPACPGCYIQVTAMGTASLAGGTGQLQLQIQENGTEVGIYSSVAGAIPGCCQWVKRNPVPGTTYTYTFAGKAATGGATFSSGAIGASIRVELIQAGG